jgi:purine-cytosine permease-like protein
LGGLTSSARENAVKVALNSNSSDSKAVQALDDHTTDIVPVNERRSSLTLGLLWVTMVTGFPTVLIGFEWFKAGLTLVQVLQGIAVSCAVLLAYGIPAAYLGARSGQTYALLSRKVFGRWGSRLVSGNLVVISMCWYGLTAVFMAKGIQGLFHIDVPVVPMAIVFAILMGINNFFGFSGIANFAKYLAAPVLIAWVGYTFIKAGSAVSPAVWSLEPTQTLPHALTMVSAFVIGYGVWGNEPDYWRYGQPRKRSSAIPLAVALLIGQVMFPVTGWLMAYLTGVTDTAAATSLMNEYAFGGVAAIAALVLFVTYFAVNDSGLYGCINCVENIKTLPRRSVVAALTVFGAGLAAFFSNNAHAFELVATTSSIVLPSATVIILVEYFILCSPAERAEAFAHVPSFAELPSMRWAALAALLIGVLFGYLTSGLVPGLGDWRMGVFSLQAWLAAAASYLCIRSTQRYLAAVRRKQLEQLLAATADLAPEKAQLANRINLNS